MSRLLKELVSVPAATRAPSVWSTDSAQGRGLPAERGELTRARDCDRPASLWRDLRERLPVDVQTKRNIYAKHLDPDALDEAWRRFEPAPRPLHEAGKLGAVLFQYPPWFVPRRDSSAEIEKLRGRLPDYRVKR